MKPPRKRKRTVVEQVPLHLIKASPPRHEKLSPEDEAFARYSFKLAGHLICNSFEEWEFGFLRDLHPSKEIMIWTSLAMFIESNSFGHKRAKHVISELLFGKNQDESLQVDFKNYMKSLDVRKELNRIFAEYQA